MNNQTLINSRLFVGMIVSITIALLLVVVAPQAAHAQEVQTDETSQSEETQTDEASSDEPVEATEEAEETTEADTENAEETSDNEEAPKAYFTYVASECDALTHFVRKSLSLFDQANDDVSLSQEAIIYAETNIVAAIGPRLLAVGETVNIDSALVEMYARSSAELTPSQIEAWSAYTEGVDFELTDIAPTEDTTEAITPVTEREAAAAEAEEQAANGDSDGLSEADTVSDDGDETSAFWWVAGGGAVGGLWYILYRRNDEV